MNDDIEELSLLCRLHNQCGRCDALDDNNE